MKKKDVVAPKPLLGRIKNNLSMGIVGFPNVGKSSTFNILSNSNVKAENYAFCTREPNLARTHVHDPRFDKLCSIWNPKSKVPASLSIWDIAGLVPDAHKGEGLGNEFLSHIQAVDGIYHMIRAFDNDEIIHTEGYVDPIRDLAVISKELIMKDLMSIDKKMDELEKRVKRGTDDGAKREQQLLLKIKDGLEKGRWVKEEDWTGVEIEMLNEHLFFTAKPVVYLVNISSKNYVEKKNKYLIKIKEWIEKNCPGKMIPFSFEFEQELAEKKSTGESAIQKIVHSGYESLNLCHFFTAGEDEVRAWTFRKGTKAPQCAGLIHSDFEKGFICAEVMKYDDFIEYGSESAVKNVGKYKQHGKEYEVQDGDIIFFKFNPPKSNKKQ